MELVKSTWTKKDGEDFLSYLESQKNEDKIEWSKRIINTNMPLLAIKTKVIYDIVKQIALGNFEQFLTLKLFDYYESTAIFASLVMSLNDFEKIKTNLIILSEIADNWATCDTIPFKKIKKQNKPKFFELAKEFSKSPLPFRRRIGIRILFEFLNQEEYLPQIYEILNSFEKETHYYVNMVNAWITCELFIKQRDLTIEFLKTNKLNKWTVNKAIQKCRDSFRVSSQDKQYLLSFKK